MLQQNIYNIIRHKGGFRMGTLCLLLLWMSLLSTNTALAQSSCSGSTPSYTVDMTGNPDSVWTSPSLRRSGTCCGVSSSNRCVQFVVTLDSEAIGVVMTVTGGSGSTFYQNSCGTAQSVGSEMCLNGTGPFYLTVCKPGNNFQTYTIQSIRRPYLTSDKLYIRPGCTATMEVNGLTTSTITWQSISGSSYNSNLSCTSSCSSTTVTYSSGFPSYVDYKVCGTPSGTSCLSTWCDTVRVYYVPAPTIAISPDPATVCPGTTQTLTTTVTGGLAPYTYLWNTGSTSSSINAALGTYNVTVKDALNCGSGGDTITVSARTLVANAGADLTVCESNSAVTLAGTVTSGATATWVTGNGIYLNGTSSLTNTYIPSPSEIAAGSVRLVLKASYSTCTTVYDTMLVTINPAPKPAISGNSQVCSFTSGYTYSTTAHTGSTYSWTVLNGSISSGQGTSSISVQWDSTGPGYIYVTETDANGCEGTGGYKTISQFDFNSSDIKDATYGPDATSADADAYPTGKGVTMNNNCGGTKGLDIALPGSTFNRGQMCMSFRFQRDEGDAIFFERGSFKLYLSGGTLYVTYKTVNSGGTVSTTGPISTGYSVPFDDVFRNYTFCFDSLTGNAKIYVDGTKIWSRTIGMANLYWTGAGNGFVGEIMDGNCSKQALIDYEMVGSPINVYQKPTAAFNGDNNPCGNVSEDYTVTGSTTGQTYLWTATNGTILSGSNSTTAKVVWDGTASSGQLSLKVTSTSTGCSDTKIMVITIKPTPSTSPIYH